MKERILVIEDDLDIQEILREFLQAKGYIVELAEDGLCGIEKFNSQRFDLVILDIMLPKIDGFVVCEMIRRTSDMPVIMLTALDDEQDELKGFELNIDDYVTKPFSVNLLIKRIEAVLKRVNKVGDKSEAKASEEVLISFGDIAMDGGSYKTWVGEKNIDLTVKEFEILEILIRNRGRVITRESLLNTVWGYDFFGDSRVIDTHIKNLRHKLNVEYIKTIRGVGYKIENKF